jgi:hypothetical protein
MDINDDNRKLLIDNFRRLYLGTQGGIFTQRTRERIMTNEGLSGRGITRNQFWYRQRENVKTALIDLQLFTEFSDKTNIDQVLTKDSLEPIITSLLRVPAEVEPDPNLAEIAEMLIHWAFEYLQEKSVQNITLSHRRTIEEAEDLSRYLRRTITGGF